LCAIAWATPRAVAASNASCIITAFAAIRSNQVWLSDIAYVPTSEGWLYLAVVLDLFTRKIINWVMRDHKHMRAELTIAALTMAIQRQKPPPGLIHHSDSKNVSASCSRAA
jgi:putative transposase